MNEALAKALEFSNFTATLNGQKRILHEKYLDDLVLYYNNGKFSISKETLNFAHMLISNNVSNTILIDDNNNPIDIADVKDFHGLALQKYADATNKYLTSYKRLIATKRSVESIVDV